MNLLVFGKSGQVATALAQECPDDITIYFLDRTEADLSNPAMCHAAIIASDADAVINAAAYTAVDAAEGDEKAATIINTDAPAAMATACAQKGIPFLHISTDYVFDGAGETPFAPDHQTRPLSAYGRSKLGGEFAIQDSGARHLILRTSWVFSATGRNFFTRMVALGKTQKSLRIVADQIGGPTPSTALAQALLVAARSMIDGHKGGIYHFAGLPYTSWADFARAIIRQAELDCKVEDIASADYPTAAKRPLNSRLDCSSFTRDFGVSLPDWRVALNDVPAKETREPIDEA